MFGLHAAAKLIVHASNFDVQDLFVLSVEQTVALTRLLWHFSLLLKHVRELEHDLARLESTVRIDVCSNCCYVHLRFTSLGTSLYIS